LLPTVVSALENEEIVKVASMSTYTLALDKTGALYIWGSGGSVGSLNGSRRDVIPKLLEARYMNCPGVGDTRFTLPYFKSRVVDISCGLGHSLFLTDSGSVHAWGNGANGRLGLGDLSDHTEACWISALEDEVVTDIQCGASHSVVLTSSGAIYTWGKNTQGQCGLGHTDDVLLPKAIRSLPINYHTIIQLAAGWEHSIALTSDGKLFSWGSGYKDNRRTVVPPVLGLGHNESRHSPNEIVSLDGVFITQIVCGWDHCLALDRNGKVLSWGSGQNGKLGQGTDENFSVPCFIAALDNVKIAYINAGCEHSAAITADGKLYTWGHGDGGRLGHGDNAASLVPKLVTNVIDMNLLCLDVHCGDKFTAIITSTADINVSPDVDLNTGSEDPFVSLTTSAKQDYLGSPTLSLKNSFDLILQRAAHGVHTLLAKPRKSLPNHLFVERSESLYISFVDTVLKSLDGMKDVSDVKISKQPCIFDDPFSTECSPVGLSTLQFLIRYFRTKLPTIDVLASKSVDGGLENSSSDVQTKSIDALRDFQRSSEALHNLVKLCGNSLAALAAFKQYYELKLTKSSTPDPNRAEMTSPKRAQTKSAAKDALSPDYNEEDDDDADDEEYDEDRYDEHSLRDLQNSRLPSSRSHHDDGSVDHEDHMTQSTSRSHFRSHRTSIVSGDYTISPRVLPYTPTSEDGVDVHRASPALSYESLNHSIASDELASTFGLSSTLQTKMRGFSKENRIAGSNEDDDADIQQAILTSMDDYDDVDNQRLASSPVYELYLQYRKALESVDESIFTRCREDLLALSDYFYSICSKDLDTGSIPAEFRDQAESVWCQLQSVISRNIEILFPIQEVVRRLCCVTKSPSTSSTWLPSMVYGLLDHHNMYQECFYVASDATLKTIMKVSTQLALEVGLDDQVSAATIVDLLDYISADFAGAMTTLSDKVVKKSLLALVCSWVNVIFFRSGENSDGSSVAITQDADMIASCYDSIMSKVVAILEANFRKLLVQVDDERELLGYLNESIASYMMPLFGCISDDLVSSNKNQNEKTYSSLQFKHSLSMLRVFRQIAQEISVMKASSGKSVYLTWFGQLYQPIFRYIAVVAQKILQNASYISVDSILECFDVCHAIDHKSKAHLAVNLMIDGVLSSIKCSRDSLKYFADSLFPQAKESLSRYLGRPSVTSLSQFLLRRDARSWRFSGEQSEEYKLIISIENFPLQSSSADQSSNDLGNFGYLSNLLHCYRYFVEQLSESLPTTIIVVDYAIMESILDISKQFIDAYCKGSHEEQGSVGVYFDSICNIIPRVKTRLPANQSASFCSKLFAIISTFQERIESLSLEYQSFFDMLSSSNGQLLLHQPVPIQQASPIIASNVATSTGDYTLGFWLRVPQSALHYASPASTVNEESSPSVRRIHLFSRVPETADFNLMHLFDFKFPCHCSPSIFLCIESDRIYISAFVTIPTANKQQNLPKSAKRIHLQSNDLNINEWIQITFSLSHDRGHPISEPTSLNDYIISSDRKVKTQQISINDTLRAKLFINGRLDQIVEAASNSNRHGLHQNVIFGGVPFITNGPDAKESRLKQNVIVSDVYWLPSRDFAVSEGVDNTIKFTHSAPPSNLLAIMRVLQKQNSLLLASVQNFLPIDDMQCLTSYSELVLRQLLTCGDDDQRMSLDTLRGIIKYHEKAYESSSIKLIVETLMSSVSMFFRGESLSFSRSPEKQQSLTASSWYTATKVWNSRCNNVKSIRQIFKQPLFDASIYPLFSINENVIITGVGVIVTDAIRCNIISLDTLASSLSYRSIDKFSFPSFLLDVCQGGYYPFGSCADQVMMLSKGLVDYFSKLESTVGSEKASRSVEDTVIFRAPARVIQVSPTKSGVWLTGCEAFRFYSQETTEPRQMLLLSSEMLYVEDRTTVLNMKECKPQPNMSTLDGITFTNLLRSLLSCRAHFASPASPTSCIVSTKTKALSESMNQHIESIQLMSCTARLRSIAVQIEKAMTTSNAATVNLIQSLQVEITNIVQLAILNQEDLISTIFESSNLKPSQLEVLKSLLRENDVNFLEKICLRQWTCFQNLYSRESLQDNIQIIAGEVSILDGKIRAQSHFPTIRFRNMALQRMTGRWFYECVLLSDGLMQIGYANNLFRCDPVCGQGVGDHYHSWAFDGLRSKKWNVTCESYGKRWKVGDVVGVLMDMDLLEMRFFLNGEDLGPAFTTFSGHDIFPAISLNVRQTIRVNYGQDKFLYPPDEVDGKPYRAVRLASMLKRSASKYKMMRSSSDSKEMDVSSKSSLDDIQIANHRLAASGFHHYSSIHSRMSERDDDESDDVDDSDDEEDDMGENEDARWHGEQRYERDTENSRERDNLAIVGESLGNTERANRILELRREALIENLIGMGFPVDWAVRAAEHGDATASEATAIAWIIERMELEQSKLDSEFSRDHDEDYEENDDQVGMEFMINRRTDPVANTAASSSSNHHDITTSAENTNRRSLMAGFRSNSSRMEITVPSDSAVQAGAGLLLASPGSAVREEVSSLRQRVNGILQGLSLQLETPKSANQSNEALNKSHSNAFAIPANRVQVEPITCKESLDFPPSYSPILPMKLSLKHHHDKEKQDVLGQISELESSDLFPIICCCEAALAIYYSRIILGKVLAAFPIASEHDATLSIVSSISPSNIGLLLVVLFKQFLSSASAADVYFFSDSDRPAFAPLMSTMNVSMQFHMQALTRHSSQGCLSSMAVDDYSAGVRVVSAIIEFASKLSNYNDCTLNLTSSDIGEDKIIHLNQLSISCSAALTIILEQCLLSFDKALMNETVGGHDQRNWIYISTSTLYLDREQMNPKDPSGVDGEATAEDRRHCYVLWAYLTLKRLFSSNILQWSQSADFIALLQKCRDGIDDPMVEFVSSKTLNRLLKVSIHTSNSSIKFFVDDLCCDILRFTSSLMFSSAQPSQSLSSHACEIFLVAASSREVYHALSSRIKAENLRQNISSPASQAMNNYLYFAHILGDILYPNNRKENFVHKYVTQDWINSSISQANDSNQPWVRVTQMSSNSITVAWNLRNVNEVSSSSNTNNRWTLRISRCSSGSKHDLEEAVPVADDLQESGGFRIDDLLPGKHLHIDNPSKLGPH
jgi:alpha-tubulin suppressor-like RCC1 family protein